MKKVLSALLLTCAFVLPALGDFAFEMTKRLAESGNPNAQFKLGVMYANGEGVPENDAEAVKWFRLAADQGDTGAQSNLGFMYASGRGVQENDAEAVKWYRLAAEQGDAKAQFKLGLMCALGRGVPQNDTKAYALLSVVKARGHDVKSALDIVKKRLTPEQLAEGQRLAAECYEKNYKGCGF